MLTIWRISISLSVLILWVLLVRFIGKKSLNKSVIVALWNLVILRALVPIQIPMEKIPFVEEIVTYIPAADRPGMLAFQSHEGLNTVSSQTKPNHEMQEYIFAVWLIGMAVACLIMIWRSLSEIHFLREIVPTECQQVTEMIKQSGIRRTIRVYTGKYFRSPVTCGILRPRIILPKDFDQEAESNVRNIILHELSHIRRFDVLKRLLMSLAVCVHWFNPLMWICLHIYRNDQETACDERVLRGMDYKAAKEYAQTLIRMSVQKEREAILFEGFQSKNAERRRILAAIENRKMGMVGNVVAILVLVSSIASFASYSPKTEALQAFKMVSGTEDGKRKEEIEKEIKPGVEPEEFGAEEHSSRKEWIAQVERYKVIWEDIVKNDNDPDEPFTDEQQEAFEYYTKRKTAEIYLEKMERGARISEDDIQNIENMYPDRSYLKKN